MYRKPNKRIFDLALEKAALRASEVWYVGDQYECDIVGARSAGIFPIWYQGAINMPIDEKKDVTTIKGWWEFPALLQYNTGKSEQRVSRANRNGAD